MYRMEFTILINLWRVPKIIETLHRMADQPDKYSELDNYRYVQYIVKLMKKTGHITVEAIGTENLPEEGGYVMYPNHQGRFDAYGIVDAHEKPATVVIDRERSYFILISDIINALRGQRLDVHNSRQGASVINQAAREVTDGRRYIIFPEGAYNNKKHNSLWDFRPGCFKAATKSHAPIVPVALADSYKVYDSWKFTPVKTQVHFLKPLYYEDYKDLTTHQIAEIVKQRIQDKLDELGCK